METSTFIKEARLKLNFTQAYLGKILEKEQPTIARYESGEITPPGDVILKIQELLYPDQNE